MKGILFKPEMIQAIIEGRKTQTRRVIKPQPIIAQTYKGLTLKDLEYDGFKPRYQVGEPVYIKEAWATEKQYDHLKPSEIPHTAKIFYVSDGVGEWPTNLSIGKLRSPLFLPEPFARYFILIKDVRAERLQEISEWDAQAEGIEAFYRTTPCGYSWEAKERTKRFIELWNSINKDYPWESNPWVFRYEFEYQSKENV
jgi:hypothetical protein